jgi:hypothetical protein
LVKLPPVIPVIPLETRIAVTTATLELHKFIADILKVTEEPTSTSKHPLKGRIIGAFEQAGCGRT